MKKCMNFNFGDLQDLKKRWFRTLPA